MRDPSVIFVAPRWIWSSVSIYWGAHNWTQHPGMVSPVLSRGEASPPSTCWQLSC